MRITDLLKKEGIVLGAAPADKRAAIDQLVALHEKCGNLLDVEAYKEGILKREEMGTAAIGMEIAWHFFQIPYFCSKFSFAWHACARISA